MPEAGAGMSTVAIAGGHGKIALLLGGLLVERGDTARGLIRNPDQEGDLRAVGIEPVISVTSRGDARRGEPRSVAPTRWSSPPAPARTRATPARRRSTSTAR